MTGFTLHKLSFRFINSKIQDVVFSTGILQMHKDHSFISQDTEEVLYGSRIKLALLCTVPVITFCENTMTHDPYLPARSEIPLSNSLLVDACN